MAPTFPPNVPAKLQNRIVVEVVDPDNVNIKLSDGTILKALTKTEYLALFPTITPSQG